jgi:hypothetical protein
MVPHPPEERSACRAAPSDPNKLRGNFLQPSASKVIFILRRAAVRYLRHRRPQPSKYVSNDAFHVTENSKRFVTRGGKSGECPENEKPADTAGLRQTLPLQENLERAKGFEPSTPTLARSCSTTELHPHPRDWRRAITDNGQSYAKCGPRMQQLVRGPESAGYPDIGGMAPK